MGGFGSGNRQQSGKLTVGACRQLDADKLKELSLFETGGKATCKWSDGFTVEVSFSGDWLTLTHAHGEAEHSYKLGALKREQNLGGYRLVFCCPNQRCLRPCKRLYLREGYFLCRICQRLGYVTQQASKADQPRLALNKLKVSLGWDSDILGGTEGKPPNIHWTTYNKLLRKHEHLESLAFRQMYMFAERLKAYSSGALQEVEAIQAKADKLLDQADK